MQKTKLSESQIVGILREAEQPGVNLLELCRKHGISDKTFYRYRRMYGGGNESPFSQLKHMQQENLRLRRLLVERDLEIDVMKEVVAKMG